MDGGIKTATVRPKGHPVRIDLRDEDAILSLVILCMGLPITTTIAGELLLLLLLLLLAQVTYNQVHPLRIEYLAS